MKKTTLTMNLCDLQHPPKNVRRHSKKQIDEMKRSINMFGQFRPIVVDENNTILAGNGLVMAMREMGEESADVIKYEGLTDKQKKKLMIADNQIANLGADDTAVIEEFIRELEGDFDVPGYDEDTLALLVAESEEVTNRVLNYGVFTPEEVDEVAQRRPMENVSQSYDASTDRKTASDSYNAPNPPAHEEEMPRSKAETQRYVICPCCGEKIYLEG